MKKESNSNIQWSNDSFQSLIDLLKIHRTRIKRDPIKNQTYSNVPAILDFLEKGAQPTGTVYDILRKAEFFKEFRISFEKKNKNHE